MAELRPIFRALGSLWFAAVLLMLLLVALAVATVFESTHGTEQALWVFYRSWWFKTLLWLLAVNVALAMVVRYPFSKRQIGFVTTHASILLILGGALLSQLFGIDGQVVVSEGETVASFEDRERDTLTITNRQTGAEARVVLPSRVFHSFSEVDQPAAPPLTLADATVSVERYLPDSEWTQHVTESDDAHLTPAIQVALSPSGRENPIWVFPQESAPHPHDDIVFRVVSNPDELARLIRGGPAANEPTSIGQIKVTCRGRTFEMPVEDGMKAAVPLGDTGYSVRVLRYLPHAIVGSDKQLTNASDRPVNPAIEVEIVGPSATTKRVAFARFPDFKHHANEMEEVGLTFVASATETSSAPVEILQGPDGKLYARFQPGGSPATTTELAVGVPVETPWPGQKFTVLRWLEHAHEEWVPEVPEDIGDNRSQALLVRVRTPEETQETWVQRGQPAGIVVGDKAYELNYGPRQLPLGFDLTLDSFEVGTYPGGNRPRSYESQITTHDPDTGRTQRQVISMNHPVKHAAYTLYQTGYRQQPGGKDISFLNVSWDPGQPVVFAGYITVMVGMVIVLGTRISEYRRRTATLAGGRIREAGDDSKDGGA